LTNVTKVGIRLSRVFEVGVTSNKVDWNRIRSYGGWARVVTCLRTDGTVAKTSVGECAQRIKT
jgi:hypothetical protein